MNQKQNLKIITAAEEEPPEQITASTANTEFQIKKQGLNQSGPSKSFVTYS
jgi:hypothetical protein